MLDQLRGDGIDLDPENYTVTLPNAAVPMISAMGAYLPMSIPFKRSFRYDVDVERINPVFVLDYRVQLKAVVDAGLGPVELE